MKTRKILLSALVAAVFLTVSCKKNKDVVMSCQVATVYLYDSSMIYDSAVYTYAGSNITKMQMSNISRTYEHNSDGLITKYNIFYSASGTVPDEYYLITYNADKTISQADFYIDGGSPELVGRMTFEYNGAKLATTSRFSISDTGSELVETNDYTYTGNNISSVLTTNYFGGQSFDYTYSYTFDGNENYLKKLNKQFFLLDPSFGYIDPTTLPLVFSANNVTGYEIQGSVFGVDYALDGNKNLSSLHVNGQMVSSYKYNCQ